MKRWLVKSDTTEIDGLVMEDVPSPQPGPGQVRIRVHAVSLNQRDLTALDPSSYYRVPGRDLVPTSDGAGEIDAVGAGVTECAVGDRVVASFFKNRPSGPPTPDMGLGLGAGEDDGMLAEQVILPASQVVPVPDGLSLEQAATLPCAGVTAWTALRLHHPVGSGSKVLVLGTGGVSILAAVIARALGAEVFATTSRDATRELLAGLGVAGVVNYADTADWGQAVLDMTGGVDKVINAAGLGSANQAMAACGAGAEVVTMGVFEWEGAIDPMLLLPKALSLRGTAVGSKAELAELVDFVATNDVQFPIAERFAFADARRAYHKLTEVGVLGKIMVTVD